MNRVHLYNNLERRKDISVPVYQCLERRWKRGDTAALLAKATGMSVREVRRRVAAHDTFSLYEGVEKIIDHMQANILAQRLDDLPPVTYREKEDSSSHKIRVIGIESIEQQLYDEVADYAIQPLKRRIGTYQIACLKNKGGAMGNRAIRRWMRDKRVRWAVQADVKKCYESIDRKKLMTFLRHAIKGSPRVLWLIKTLISTHRKGLNIGCKLSQDLVNIYLSILYHELTERMVVIQKRRGVARKHNAAVHVLFQMDDILILCASLRDAQIALKRLIQKAAELGITIKPNWRIFELDNPDNRRKGLTYVDIIGVRFYRHRRTLRRHVYITARRGLSKVQMLIRMHRRVPLKLAQRVVSHTGSLKWTEHFKLWKKYKVAKSLRVCKEVISHESKIFYTAGTC